MFTQSTRLELAIVGAALLVLLLCRQPPKSGNAGVRVDADKPEVQNVRQARETPMPGAGQRMDDRAQMAEDRAILNPQSAIMSPPASTGGRHPPSPSFPLPAVDSSANAATSDNYASLPPEPRPKRIAMVDARRCRGLNYKDIMYGEVKVQWVWNGQKDVFRKVVEVKEPNGATSVWAFDERDDVIISEIQQ